MDSAGDTASDPAGAIDYEALFAAHREHLWGLCYRVTGDAADAEDLVQETFRRALETPPPDTSRPWRPWLARVATRLAIDALRRRRTRRHAYVGPWLPSPVETEPGASRGELVSPEVDAETRYDLRESVSLAFLHALEQLGGLQRAALVLRDALGYTGPETAALLGVTPEHARVVLHRARKAMAGYDAERRPASTAEVDAQHLEALQRFMGALLSGDVERITACLAQDARVAADAGGRYRSALKIVRGRDKVARFFEGILARPGSTVAASRPTWINGRPGVATRLVPHDDRDAPRSCMTFDIHEAGQVTAVYIISAPDKLGAVRFPEP